MTDRLANIKRKTKETDISLELSLNAGASSIDTGIPFFDHMLSQLAKHADISLNIVSRGDINVDLHHSVEDTGIVLGEGLKQALGDKAGIKRFSSIMLPLDEALIAVALDISGRPFLAYNVEFEPDSLKLGDPPFDPLLGEDFFRALCVSAGITLHINKLAGKNSHHILEATFKGFARVLKDAIAIDSTEVPSTKGTL
jgi:imidazoleglycerol-phosphate dehydratase